MAYQRSKIDELFYDVMGYYPTKEGAAYEMMSTAILALLTEQNARHNNYMVGSSGCKYQLDGIIDQHIMLEAKDYTKRGQKVGRDDLQKMQGALIDLENIDKGYFTSATQYTSEASKYAEGTKRHPVKKEIVPIELRPSTPKDEENRINTIVCHINTAYPDYEKGEFGVMFAEGERERLNEYIRNNNLTAINIHIEFIYNDRGETIMSIQELSSNHKVQIDNDTTFLDGVIDVDAYIEIDSMLYRIKGLTYKNVPIRRASQTITIKSDGTPTLLVKSEELGINKLITNNELKRAIEHILEVTHNEV